MSSQPNRLPWIIGAALVFVFLCSICVIAAVAVTPLMVRRSSQPEISRGVVIPQPESAAPVLIPTPDLTPQPTPSLPPLDVTGDQETEIYTRVYEAANPSIVAVRTLDADTSSQAPDIDPIFFGTSEGSGFVIDTLGDIVTNRHVVEGATKVAVQFSDGAVAPAEIVGVDRDSDLAVIKIDPAGFDLRPLPIGNVDDLKVGGRVMVIGNPFGNANTLTTGIISALGRQINLPDSQFILPEVIQTDAAINPGNSGGPMLNANGEVIGVTFMLQSETATNSGIGFGIPAYFVERVAKAIIANGVYEHPWLGVRGQSLSPFISRQLDLPVDRGVLVTEAIPDSPADKAGLKGGSDEVEVEGLPFTVGGDIITAIDGTPVSVFDDLLAYLSRYTEPGKQVVLTVVRDGKTVEFTVTLEPRPETIGE